MFKSVWWNKVNRIKKKKIVFSNWNWYWLPLKIKSELDLVQKKKFDVTSLVWTKSPWCESNLPVWMRSRPDWSSWHMTDYLHMLIWSAKLGLCCHIHQRQLLSTFFLPLRLCSVLLSPEATVFHLSVNLRVRARQRSLGPLILQFVITHQSSSQNKKTKTHFYHWFIFHTKSLSTHLCWKYCIFRTI